MCFNGIHSESLNKTIKLTSQIISKSARTSAFSAGTWVAKMSLAQQCIAAMNNPAQEK